MVTHSNILAWKNPGTEEPGGLQPTGVQRVEHNWACVHEWSIRGCSRAHTQTHTHTVNLQCCVSFRCTEQWFSLIAWSCLILCEPMDCSLPGSSVHGILQARIPQWFAIPLNGKSPWMANRIHISWIGRQSLYSWAIREAPLSLIHYYKILSSLCYTADPC